MLCEFMVAKEGMISMKTRTYSEFRRLKTFNERFEYLNLQGEVGESTFGFDRYLNQNFYRSREWKQIRDFVIIRNNGCDLGVPGREIFDKIIIHHMKPHIVTGKQIGRAHV